MAVRQLEDHTSHARQQLGARHPVPHLLRPPLCLSATWDPGSWSEYKAAGDLMTHLTMSTAMPTKNFPLRAKDALPRLLIHLHLLFNRQGTHPSRGAQHDQCGMPSCSTGTPDRSLSLPPEINFSLVNNTGTPPEHLINAVRNLRPFLPIGCELLGEGNLKVVGSKSHRRRWFRGRLGRGEGRRHQSRNQIV